MEKLTKRQQEVLEIITEYLSEHGYPPSLRDIGKKLAVTGTLGVMKHLEALQKKVTCAARKGARAALPFATRPRV
jgi:repressor LexA